MRHVAELINICENLANRPDAPARVVDWACDLYDALLDMKKGVVRTEDLVALQTYGEDARYGLLVIDALLSRR